MWSVLRTVRYAVLAALVFFVVSSVGIVVLYKWLPVGATPLMFLRCGQQIGRGEAPRWHHAWVSIDEMSEALPRAVVASEDQKFLSHHGFDFEQIQKAQEEMKSGKRRRGASTISQQTAKNVFLWPQASWLRKGLEAYFTVLIELIWGKERIMEVYLNSIEMGDGVYGAEAVAVRHFGVHASELSRAQCALVAASLPNPLKMSSKNPSSYVLRRQGWILGQMKNVKNPLFPHSDEER